MLRVSILSSSLEEIIDKSNITEQGIVYVYNSKRQILLCSNRELAQGLSLFADPTANSLMEKQPVWRTCRLGQGKYLVNARDVENTDWKLVAMIPSSEVFYQPRSARAASCSTSGGNDECSMLFHLLAVPKYDG